MDGESLRVRFADCCDDVLSGRATKERLDHAYAVTVHRMQGATVDRAHVLADGGGRELAYVAMSRARESSDAQLHLERLGQAQPDRRRKLGLS